MFFITKLFLFQKLCFGMDDSLATYHCEGLTVDVVGISTLSVFKEATCQGAT